MDHQQPSQDTARGSRRARRFAPRIIIGTVGVALFIAAFFWLAGRLDWLRGWAYVLLLIVGQTASALYIWRRNPELLIRRGEIGAGTKSWDKIVLTLFGLIYLSILIVAALDERYNWSTMSGWLWLVGGVLYVAFVLVLTWAMDVNPHFEKTVRIQEDRGHRVIDSGPYRIVRHPGYTATILGLIFAAPLLLGSWWAFIPAVLAAVCLSVRTVLEDRTLRLELPGYEEYTKRVRYRMLPGLW